MSAINVASHPRRWVGIIVALAAAAAFAVANTSASVAYHGGSNGRGDSVSRAGSCAYRLVAREWHFTGASKARGACRGFARSRDCLLHLGIP